MAHHPPEVIPMFRELLMRPGLTRAAVLLYGVLEACDTGGGVTATLRELSALSGLSPHELRKGSLRRYMCVLVSAGLVRKTQAAGAPGRSGGALTYHVLGPRRVRVAS